MHIKQIIIKGFKTYREQAIVGPLSARDNVVVGQNGHGKSNFFSAIMFVLSDKFSNIRNEEKQRLIHEGAEVQDCASVEIILDNSDSRLPIEKSTVSIKRVLEDKKDEFFIDGKHVTKGDINNLLESAGFSKSNPYYVVQQGRVASLAGMNEAQCLDLLKEVAGTTVYDDRKLESERLMEDTRRKKEKILDITDRIKEKIDELHGESTELQEYTKIEKERRAIEYILYKNHVVTAQEQIDVIESQQSDIMDKLNTMKLTCNSIQEEIDKYEQITDSKSVYEKKINSFLVGLGIELGRLQSDKVQIESKLLIYREKRKKTMNDHSEYSQELKVLRENLKKSERELNDLRPLYKNIMDQEHRFFEQLSEKERRKEQLFIKQGSASRFKTIKERNVFLNNELKKLEEVKKDTVYQVDKVNSELNTLKGRLEELNAKLPGYSAKIQSEKQINEELSVKCMNIKQQRAENAGNLAAIRHEEEQLVSNIEQIESKIAQNSQKLQILLPGSLFSTLEKLKVACADLPGFYGPLIDLINIPARFQTCADIVSKSKVFAIVVDNFETAKKVLDKNSSLAGDRINIYSLDWVSEIQKQAKEFPTGSDSIALIKQITVKEGVKMDILPIIQQIFGKSLLVRNQEVANRYAKDYNLHCVTPDGQMVQAGAYIMRAGFHDSKKEKIRTYLELFNNKNELCILKQNLTNLIRQKDEYLTKDSQLQRLMQEISNEKENSNGRLAGLKNTESVIKVAKQEAFVRINELENAQQNFGKSLRQIEDNICGINQGLARNDLGDLSVAESGELEGLIKEIQDLENNYRHLGQKKNEVSQEMQKLNQQITIFLPERERKLEEMIADCLISLDSKDEYELEEDNRHTTKLLEGCESEIQKYNQDLMDCKINIRNSEDEIKQRKDNLMRINHEINELTTEIEKIALKLVNLAENKENYIKKMGSLGSLPAEEHDKLKSEHPETLKQLLESNSKKLKKYQHVNKRALEQYNKYVEKMETLNEKILDLEKSENSIQDLLIHLESVKDDAIVRTFRSVAQHFSEVFHEIVPQGKGRLKMVKGEGVGVDKYVGVSISVSFSRSEEAVYKMQQLSGGQKTAVAIALIVAIQRADPAPFYLFDELDAALDSQLRNSLASLIARSSEKAQFIMTTFKPELCQNASKLFEVKFKNKASTIKQIDKNRALEVIQQMNNTN